MPETPPAPTVNLDVWVVVKPDGRTLVYETEQEARASVGPVRCELHTLTLSADTLYSLVGKLRNGRRKTISRAGGRPKGRQWSADERASRQKARTVVSSHKIGQPLDTLTASG